MDGSKPLGLLKHVGGNPILGIVGRRKVSLEHYDTMEKWAKVGWKYMEELALPRVPEEEREKVTAFLNDLKPLLIRLNYGYIAICCCRHWPTAKSAWLSMPN